MSERVLPTKPGWWWASMFDGVQILYVERCGDNLIANVNADVEVSPVGLVHEIDWLAPVPSAAAVQAAVEAMTQSKSAMKAWMRECDWRVFVANRDNAIAGLTGGDG